MTARIDDELEAFQIRGCRFDGSTPVYEERKKLPPFASIDLGEVDDSSRILVHSGCRT